MDIDVVKILGVGLSGFGFILMYLAYMLINRIINNERMVTGVSTLIITYMVLCFIMTVTVGIFTYITTSYKNNLIAAQSQTINNASAAVSVLTAAQKNTTLANTLAQPASSGSTAAKAEQKKVLDTLTKYVSKSQNKPLIDTFNHYKSVVASYPFILRKINPSNTMKIDSLTAAYKRANIKINEVSVEVSKRRF